MLHRTTVDTNRRPLLIALLVAGAALLGAAPGGAAPSPAQAQATTSEADNLDTIVLRNGRVVKGRILEETDAYVKIVVVVAGIEAETTYNRSEILRVVRASKERPSKPQQPTTPTRPPSPAAQEHKAPRQTSPGQHVPVLYILPLKGHIVGDPVGYEYLAQARRNDIITVTPFKQALEDARKHDPDVVVIEIDADSPAGFDGMFVAQPFYEVVEQAMKEGVRIVFWVKRAVAGAAFLPFISPEIYFKSDGLLGGVGNLSDLDYGDRWVTEKQISLRLGIAEGYAIQGGYDPALVRAMARRENWLFVRWEGGKPVYLEREPRPSDGPGWTLLSDDGEGDNADTSVVEQNDVLQLNADWAQRLLVAKGVADTVEDLAFLLGFGDGYRLERGKARKILEDWSKRVASAVEEIQRQQDVVDENGSGGSGEDARIALGKQIAALRRIRSLMTVYAEALDPSGDRRAQTDLQIQQLRRKIRELRDR
ncbi:MAG: hypothetical protein D6824_03550 [Planctomycetota bacterium]|nr:MAG: hypothetical protein D6824_03550 [Planctomycetota bacterium]